MQLNKLMLEIFLINYYLTLFFNLDPFELKSWLRHHVHAFEE